MTIKEFDTRPTLKSTFEGFKDYSYTYSTAIPEFIDNAIASFRENNKIIRTFEKQGKNFETTISIIFNRRDNQLIIRDSAFGIAEKDFQRSLRIGQKKEEQGGLNEFGKGLKTAAFWFGQNLEIITRSYFDFKESNYYAEGAKYSLLWKNIENDEAHIRPHLFDAKNCVWRLKHGTVVTVSDIYKGRMLSNSAAKDLAEKLSSKYRRDIINNNIKIFIYAIENNGRIFDINSWIKNGGNKNQSWLDSAILQDGVPLTYNEPEVLKDKDTSQPVELEFDYTFQHENIKHKVSGKIYQLKKGSRSNAGLDLYRRDRIVEENFELFYPDKSGFKYQRIRGYLNLDTMPISQTKDKILWEGDLLDKVIKNFRKVEGLKEFEDHVQNYRVKAENTKEEIKKIESLDSEELDGNGISFEKQTLTQNIKEKYHLESNDGMYVVNTNQIDQPLTVIIKRVYDINQHSWLIVEEKDGKYIVKLDVNHVFFNPFNDLKENGQFGEKFIKTMTKFAIYWAVSEKISMNKKYNAEEFRRTLSNIIERNVENDKN